MDDNAISGAEDTRSIYVTPMIFEIPFGEKTQSGAAGIQETDGTTGPYQYS